VSPSSASAVIWSPSRHVGSCPAYELDAEPDPADAEVMQSLMSVGSQSALEFLA
jgi:hypothetical protein